MNLDHILNWRLLAGSHDFPGPDGGTCLNEAAVVAAGFAYRKINSADECPPCFSRPVAAYAIDINDRMPDDLRDELLMPFVLRLSGTADTPDVERRRLEYMIVQIARRLIAPQLEELKIDTGFAAAVTLKDVSLGALDLTRALARARAVALALDLDLARYLDLDLARARALALDLDLALARALALDLARALALALDLALDLDLALALARARDLDLALARALPAAARRQIWDISIEIFDQAIRIGEEVAVAG